MRLSERIYKIAEKIERGESVADIGTDHAYVPMLLLRDDISPRVIMSDISEGSLAKAKETFKTCKIEVPDDWFRIGDGLESIEASEVDVLVIAGLGGFTIKEILSSNISKSKSYKKLVLQPRKHSGELRYFLCTNGWQIQNEDLALEGKFACEIITAIPVTEQTNDVMDPEPPYPKDDIRWNYPKDMVLADPELAGMRIEWKINSIKDRLVELERANETKGHDSVERNQLGQKLRSDLEYLTSLI